MKNSELQEDKSDQCLHYLLFYLQLSEALLHTLLVKIQWC